MNIGDDQAFPEQVNGVFATANLFGVLGIHPILGRDFLPEDDRAGAEPVVLIGHRMWRDRFASDPDVLGKTLRVNNTAATIIGVMPEGMEFPDNHQLWVPWTPFYAQYAAVRERRGLTPVARVANKDDRQSANAALTGLARSTQDRLSGTLQPCIRRRPFALNRSIHRRQSQGHVRDHHGSCHLRAADRLCERCEPAPVPLGSSSAGDSHSHEPSARRDGESCANS